jgi:hypothetical protein
MTAASFSSISAVHIRVAMVHPGLLLEGIPVSPEEQERMKVAAGQGLQYPSVNQLDPA